THIDWELIVIDDGSKDRTLEIARSYESRDARVRVFTQPHSGIAHTLNHAIELAKYEWIARMDADDLMEPNRLERPLAFLATNPDLSVASSLVYYINEAGAVVGHGRSLFTDRRTAARFTRKNRIVTFNHPAVILCKSVLKEVGGYRPEFEPAEDCDLWNRI